MPNRKAGHRHPHQRRITILVRVRKSKLEGMVAVDFQTRHREPIADVMKLDGNRKTPKQHQIAQ